MEKIKILISSLALTLIFSGAAYSMSEKYSPLVDIGIYDECSDKYENMLKDHLIINENYQCGDYFSNAITELKKRVEIMKEDEEITKLKIEFLDNNNKPEVINLDMIKIIEKAINIFMQFLAKQKNPDFFMHKNSMNKAMYIQKNYSDFEFIEHDLNFIKNSIKSIALEEIKKVKGNCEINKKEVENEIDKKMNKICTILSDQKYKGPLHPFIMLCALIMLPGFDIPKLSIDLIAYTIEGTFTFCYEEKNDDFYLMKEKKPYPGDLEIVKMIAEEIWEKEKFITFEVRNSATKEKKEVKLDFFKGLARAIYRLIGVKALRENKNFFEEKKDLQFHFSKIFTKSEDVKIELVGIRMALEDVFFEEICKIFKEEKEGYELIKKDFKDKIETKVYRIGCYLEQKISLENPSDRSWINPFVVLHGLLFLSAFNDFDKFNFYMDKYGDEYKIEGIVNFKYTKNNNYGLNNKKFS